MALSNRILIVDDDPSLLIVLEQQLRLRGYEPESVDTGAEALRRASENIYAVVMTDIRMPCMSGLELTREIKRVQPDAAVILMTGYGSLDTAAEGLRLGASDYLLKPFDDMELVIASIERAMTRRRLEAEAAELRFRLVQADRLAAIGQLAAGVAHEINNPAAFVLGNLSVIKERLARLGPESGADELRAMIDDSLQGVERIVSITRELRVFARSEAEPVTPTSVNDVVATALTLVGRVVRARARLVVELGEVPLIGAHRGRLAQVVVNLLVNAAQAIPEGASERHTVSARTRRIADHVVIEVEDTGSGMTDEVRQHLFEPFFTTKPGVQGTGLGLPLSADIVRAHGGEIRVRTAPSAGSRFEVWLPLDTRLIPGGEPAVPVAAPPASELRVLMIDDEPLLLTAFQRMLEDRYDVVTAQSGGEAIELLQRDRAFDAIVCDVTMPGIDGIQVWATLSQTDPALAGRFVFATGGAITAQAREFIAQHESRVLEKPFTVEKLREAIERAAGKRS